MNPLKRCVGELSEYFHLLGGSHRYNGFRNWHLPAYVMLLSRKMDRRAYEEFEDKHDTFDLLPNPLWESCAPLNEKLLAILSDKPSPDDWSDFMQDVTSQAVRFKDPREKDGWDGFLRLMARA